VLIEEISIVLKRALFAKTVFAETVDRTATFAKNRSVERKFVEILLKKPWLINIVSVDNVEKKPKFAVKLLVKRVEVLMERTFKVSKVRNDVDKVDI
jgi:hypothetical protein